MPTFARSLFRALAMSLRSGGSRVVSWLSTRWRVALASTAAVALAASIGVVALQQPATAPVDAVDCSVLVAETFEDAGPLARACDAEVEVASERTPWQTSWADGEGARLDVTSVPSRAQVAGKWVPIDPTLTVDKATGGIAVAASVYPISINPGGTAGAGKPLGTITREGHTLEVWFPLDLPAPTISGSQAIYTLDTGIRLVVSIEGDTVGFLPVIELADAEAAARFQELLDADRAEDGGVSAGLELELATSLSEGLTMTVDEQSVILVTDDAGDPQFFAPTPIMWDSSGETIVASETATEVGSTDRTRAPGGGDAISVMPVRLDGSTIVVSPDAALLESEDTVWPVYIDPGFNAWGHSIRVAVRTGQYTNTLVNWTDLNGAQSGQGTGNCNVVSTCTKSFKQRLAWQFGGLGTIGAMAGTDITNAKFTVYGSHSYNCTARTTYLLLTSPISASSLWGNLSWGSTLGTRTEAHSASCGNRGYKDFDATAGVQLVANSDANILAVGLYVDETSMSFWKRFAADVTLSVSYNRAPNAPSSLQLTSPAVPTCVTGAGRPVIATTTPTLSAISSDPDGDAVHSAFYVTEVGYPATSVWTSGNLAAIASSQRASAAVPAGKLVDGKIYSWVAQATDGYRYSASSTPCEFQVDITSPLAPSVTPVNSSSVHAVYEQNKERGGLGQMGQFTLNRGTVSTDVTSFLYGFDTPNPTTAITPLPDGTAVVNFTPTTTGQKKLYVRSRDAAGNLSPITLYTFDVASPTEDGVWMFDEGTGVTAEDIAGEPERPMTLQGGASWTEGPHSLFQSREGDHALLLDGIDDFASTDAVVIDTGSSFTVAAFVWLDPARIAQGQGFTALGQDSTEQAPFRLGYVPTCAASASGCWSFSMSDMGIGPWKSEALSTTGAVAGEWVLLVGEHDVADDKIRLWSCEVGTPTDPSAAEPYKTEVTRSGAVYDDFRPLTVGRGWVDGAPGGYWPGAIDNVRVFSGEVLAESKIRRLCSGAESSDFGGTPSGIDPTEDGQ